RFTRTCGQAGERASTSTPLSARTPRSPWRPRTASRTSSESQRQLVDGPVPSQAFVVIDDRHPLDRPIPGDVGEAQSRPRGVGGGIAGFGGEVEPAGTEAFSTLTESGQQCGGDTGTAMCGMGDDVLNVDIVRFVLTTEGHDGTHEFPVD